MPHHHVGLESKLGKQFINRGIEREHRGLCNRRLLQFFVRAFQNIRVGALHKYITRQRFAQNRRHHLVRIRKHLRDRRRIRGEFASHVQVLRTLSRKQKRDFALRIAAAAKNALRLQRFPRLRRIKAHRLARLVNAFEQFIMISKIHHDALALFQFLKVNRFDRRRITALHARKHFIQFIFQFIRV